jgi:hypothetical protein
MIRSGVSTPIYFQNPSIIKEVIITCKKVVNHFV